MGRHGPILRLSWGHLGSFLGFPGGAGPPKTLIFLKLFKVFAFGPCFFQLRLPYPILCNVIFFLGPLGVILGLFWTPLGPSWGYLGPILEPSWAILALPWALLGPPWGHLGGSWGLLGRLGGSRGYLGPSWGSLGPAWRHLGARVGHLGASLSHLGAFWGDLGTYWGLLGVRSWLCRGQWTSQNLDICSVFESSCYFCPFRLRLNAMRKTLRKKRNGKSER